MTREQLKEFGKVYVHEGDIDDESYIPYEVRVLEVPENGRIKGLVMKDGGGSQFEQMHLGLNYQKGSYIWFAPFQASPR